MHFAVTKLEQHYSKAINDGDRNMTTTIGNLSKSEITEATLQKNFIKKTCSIYCKMS